MDLDGRTDVNNDPSPITVAVSFARLQCWCVDRASNHMQSLSWSERQE
jgi:hypothetical protein